ncbi:MAG: hypothetical protein J0H68_04555 [Sphingobacteriia bacterium]|nr:hypothetical protein [Sphingobacteriia bacterium]
MRNNFDKDFYKNIARHSMFLLPSILFRWLPDGKIQGNEYVARNPKRYDQHYGSFKINIRTGKWCDFATGDKGGDLISLAAYLFNLSQYEAAKEIAKLAGGRYA